MKPGVPVVFTAHSVPCRTIQGGNEGDPYGVQARETAALVAAAALMRVRRAMSIFPE